MNRKPQTFRETIARALIHGVMLMCLAGGGAAVVMAAQVDQPVDFAPFASTDNYGRPHADGSAAKAAEGHDCDLPEGALPGHVVARKAHSDRWEYLGGKAVHQAFEQMVFDGVLDANEFTQPVDHGMDVSVFCE